MAFVGSQDVATCEFVCVFLVMIHTMVGGLPVHHRTDGGAERDGEIQDTAKKKLADPEMQWVLSEYNLTTEDAGASNHTVFYHHKGNFTFNYLAYVKNKDATVATIVMLILCCAVFGSVYYTKMWRHNPNYYSSGTDYDFLSTYSNPRSIQPNTKLITDILKTRLKYLSKSGKRKARKLLNWHRKHIKNSDKRPLLDSEEDERDVFFTSHFLDK